MAKNTDLAPAVVWLRNDLRLDDNPALRRASDSGAPVIPLYIFDSERPRPIGAASKWWLHHTLAQLAERLNNAGAPLVLRHGDEATILHDIVEETGAGAVYWNRRYFPADIEIDKALKADLQDAGVDVQTFGANLLREPWELKTGSGGYYKVFSPFWRALQKFNPARHAPEPGIRKLKGHVDSVASDALGDWALTPHAPDWASAFPETWTPGEVDARKRLTAFLSGPIAYYVDGRNNPDAEYTSRLSPHLAFGEISPLTIWRETNNAIADGRVSEKTGYKFLSEIAWREFSYTLLFHNGDLPDQPLRKEFANYPWLDDPSGLKAWRRGMTGYPIVDAGMRQLWRTGWMHNRVRMIAASFLIKDLLIDWRDGEAWFWDTLLDADIANNSASWQWVAGCGADAAPYFRIFNPVTQGQKFDPDGEYVRTYVPELANLASKYIHAPWTAPENELQQAEITLGKTYPFPMLDHAEARKRALRGYEEIKAG